MKNKFNTILAIVLIVFTVGFAKSARAGIYTFTATVNNSVSTVNTFLTSSNSTTITIGTNTTALIRHLHETTSYVGTGGVSGGGYLTINYNGIESKYTESTISAVNNQPIVIGPATITLTAVVTTHSNQTGGNYNITGQDNMICTVETNLLPANVSSVVPANSVVIPSDATGPVQILLESSSDLVNWIASTPGTYGNTYSNRFFRVRAIAQ